MAEETEKTSIKQLIQGMTSNEIEILQGIVKSESPFKILRLRCFIILFEKHS